MLLSVLAVFHPAFAQQAQAPTLDDILSALENNLHHYDTGVPSFFCDEHVVSTMAPGPKKQNATTESTFRLKRVLNPDHKTTLEESREVKTIDGHPASGDEFVVPALVRGAFSGGLSIVSLSQKTCMHYTLEPIKPNSPREPYVVEFSSLPSNERPTNCLLQEDGSGRIFIDPGTMEIKRMELAAPHHTVFAATKTANGFNIPPIIGAWDLSVDYSPILLGGQSFWLPATITSSTISTSGVPSKTVWSFLATYRNYHKLEVTSRILPFDGQPVSQPH
jgi:hypothetical protein